MGVHLCSQVTPARVRINGVRVTVSAKILCLLCDFFIVFVNILRIIVIVNNENGSGGCIQHRYSVLAWSEGDIFLRQMFQAPMLRYRKMIMKWTHSSLVLSTPVMTLNRLFIKELNRSSNFSKTQTLYILSFWLGPANRKKLSHHKVTVFYHSKDYY